MEKRRLSGNEVNKDNSRARKAKRPYGASEGSTEWSKGRKEDKKKDSNLSKRVIVQSARYSGWGQSPHLHRMYRSHQITSPRSSSSKSVSISIFEKSSMIDGGLDR